MRGEVCVCVCVCVVCVCVCCVCVVCGCVCGVFVVCVCVCLCVLWVCVCVCVWCVCVCVFVLESARFEGPEHGIATQTGFSTRGSCYSGIGYMDKCDKCSPSEVLPPHYLGNRKC